MTMLDFLCGTACLCKQFPARKLRVAVLFGDQSTEHEVSVMSARNVVKAIDDARYEIVPVLIDRTGHWLMAQEG